MASCLGPTLECFGLEDLLADVNGQDGLFGAFCLDVRILTFAN